MVVIHIKDREGDEFLYETTVDIKIDDLIEQLVSIHNLRIQAKYMVEKAREIFLQSGKEAKKDDVNEEVGRICDKNTRFVFLLWYYFNNGQHPSCFSFFTAAK